MLEKKLRMKYFDRLAQTTRIKNKWLKMEIIYNPKILSLAYKLPQIMALNSMIRKPLVSSTSEETGLRLRGRGYFSENDCRLIIYNQAAERL